MKALLFAPPDAVIDASLDARRYLDRLARRLQLERRSYGDAATASAGDADSMAVLAGLSALEPNSGYMEMDLDTLLDPPKVLRALREKVAADYPIVAVLDDAYSDHITASYLKAGASAVVGTSGALFGVVTSRMPGWDAVVPFINAYRSV